MHWKENSCSPFPERTHLHMTSLEVGGVEGVGKRGVGRHGRYVLDWCIQEKGRGMERGDEGL